MDFYPTLIESYQRRLSDVSAVFLLIILIILFPLFWLVYFVHRLYSLRMRGFWVAKKGHHTIEYEELRNGEVERLGMYSEMSVGAPNVVYVPTEKEWKQKMPDWAQGRREEILERVKHKLGTRRYEYYWSSE